MVLALLEIEDLYVRLEGSDTPILRGINLVVNAGEIHAIMGPNGSGKSTLAHTIMGNPRYIVTKGNITFDGLPVVNLSPDERAKLGIFLSFQHPPEIPGVKLRTFMGTVLRVLEKGLNPLEMEKKFQKAADSLKLSSNFLMRYLNVGMSGGERKKSEVLQMKTMEPRLIILDEIDSGLDVDALKLVSEVISEGLDNGRALLIITHYSRILNYISPHKVHILMNGRIVRSDGAELVRWVEEKGYSEVKNS
ncbi:MAG: Fe-S cluster assembly ATPase SufC [Thermotogae bacterium]|nr:Fe-S cluster assembly ATPase SufC [Thermotogota bacterium]